MDCATWCQASLAVVENLASSLILFGLGYFIGRRRGHRKVAIHARLVDELGRKRPKPKIALATFSGYPERSAPAGLTKEAFRKARREGNLEVLPIDEKTDGIGQIVRLLRAYESSLEELILITTLSKIGASSKDSAPLIESWAQKNLARPIKITAHGDDSVDLDQDDNVTNDSYEVARDIFQRLEKDGRYNPKEVLVDVTGSVRSMQMGVLLACLRPDQDAHLIGVKYHDDGTMNRESSFPMLIHFEPELGSR
jgi:hypothetical protein